MRQPLATRATRAEHWKLGWSRECFRGPPRGGGWLGPHVTRRAKGRGERGSGAAVSEVVPWLDAVQMPGDVLWVPSQWGHATISLAESVAVAVEYV